MATGSVDGLVSGLDTTSLIRQLMQLERQPQVRLQQKQTLQEARAKGYQAVNSRFATLRSASDALTKADAWQAHKVTSSTASVVATASTSALPGSYSFTVLELAKAHSTMTQTTYASTSDQVTASPTITLTKNGVASDPIDVGDGSLASVVRGINAAGAGIKAAAVKIAEGQYALSLTSTDSGTKSTFTADASLGAFTTLTTGADAKIGMGDRPVDASGNPTGPHPVEITSSSNTFADVLPGVTFTVSKLEAATIDVSVDSAGIAGKVQSMVDAANAVLQEIDGYTAFNSTTNERSILTGDSTLRSLKQRLLNVVSSSLTGGTLADVGVELTKGGRLEFTKATFEAALASDPTGTRQAFAAGGTTSHPTLVDQPKSVSFVYAGDAAVAGAYDVVVTRAASRAALTLTGAIAGTETLTLSVGDTEVQVLAQGGDTAATLATRINGALAGTGLGLVAADEGGQVVVRAGGYGSGTGFSVTSTGGTLTPEYATARLSGLVAGTEEVTITVPSAAPLTVTAQPGDDIEDLADRIRTAATAAALGLLVEVRSGAIVITPDAGGPASVAVDVTGGTLAADVTGLDVQGSINGVTAHGGNGQLLVAPVEDPTLWGMTLEVNASQADVDAAAGAPNNGLFGTFTYAPGVAQRLDSIANDAIRAGTGQLTGAIEGSERIIDDLESQIAAYDVRLELRELALRRQFSTLEVALGKLRDQSNWLAGQLAGLPSGSST